MQEIRDLERQIQQLQRELDRQNSEAAKRRQELVNENMRRLQNYEREMKQNLDMHDRNVQRQYESLLREYQDSVNDEILEQQLKMDLDYQKLLISTKTKEREWLEKSKQMEALVSELKKRTQDKDAVSDQEYQRYLGEAAQAYKAVEKKPHEKFCPKRIGPFHQAISEARTLDEGGLVEAAIAILITTRSGLNRLGFEIDEQYEAWNNQYQLYKSKLNLMRMKLINEVTTWHSFTRGSEVDAKLLSEKDKEVAKKSINYWTNGVYGDIFKKTVEFARVIAMAEKEGLDNYLKRQDSLSLDDMKKNVAELDKMNKDLEKELVLYKQRYSASCQRADWGEMIIDFLSDEINLVWVDEESHFRFVDEEKSKKIDYIQYMQLQYGEEYEKVDTREWLELVFLNSQETKIFVYIVPHEKDKTVKNGLVLYLDYAGAVNEDYSRQIYMHICESINYENDDELVSFTTNVEELKTNNNAMLRAAGKSIETKIRKMK